MSGQINEQCVIALKGCRNPLYGVENRRFRGVLRTGQNGDLIEGTAAFGAQYRREIVRELARKGKRCQISSRYSSTPMSKADTLRRVDGINSGRVRNHFYTRVSGGRQQEKWKENEPWVHGTASTRSAAHRLPSVRLAAQTASISATAGMAFCSVSVEGSFVNRTMANTAVGSPDSNSYPIDP